MTPRFSRILFISGAPRAAAAGAAAALVAAFGTGCPASGTGGKGEVPEEIVIQNSLGAAAMGQQELEKAIAIFSGAVEKRPGDPLLLSNLALAEMQKGMFDEAEDHLNQALALAPDDPAANFRLGLVLKNRGANPEAIAAFEKVEKADPDDIVTLYQLGSLRTRSGDPQKGIEEFERALKLDPTHVSALYGLGRAYMTIGQTDKGAEILARSQRIKEETGAGDTVGLQYGEQGKYSVASEYPAASLAAPAESAARYEAVAGAIPNAPSGAVLPLLLNADNDGTADLLLTHPGGFVLLRGNGDATFAPGPALPAPAAGSIPAGAAAGDLTNDGTMDLVVLTPHIAFWKGTGGAAFSDATNESGLAAAGAPSRVLVVDADHDGDLDLALGTMAGGKTTIGVWINDGSAKFTPRVPVAMPDGTGAPVGLAETDFDNDRDVDFAAAFHDDGTAVMLNRRDRTYELLAAATAPGLAGLAVADLNKDGMTDLVTVTSGGARAWANRLGRSTAEIGGFSRAAGSTDAFAACVTDADNDGFQDVALLTGAPASPVVALIRNLGAGQWKNISDTSGAGALGATGAAGIDTADLDGDGDLDLVAGANVLRNAAPGPAHWVSLALTGLGDNKFGAGTKVEIRAGSLWQRFEAGSAGLPVHLGLGAHRRVDSVRMLWMGGVLQDEIEIETGKTFGVEQLDRKGTSCPILYAWDGERISFVTDFLGGSAYGYLESPGTWSIPDTDEYVKIRGDQLAARDGVWDVRLVNQLEEVILFDRAELLVVDHPAELDIFPNERLMPAPPFPPARIWTAGAPHAPAWVRDDAGRDVTGRIGEEDRATVDGFALLPPKGYAAVHSIEFPVGDAAASPQALLLLDGWIDYADSTSNTAAAQAGLTLMPPRLDARRPGGAWRTAIASTGFPAGLPKTMTVDLTGRLRPGETEVRIVTSMRIYWDRVRVSTAGAGGETRVTRLKPSTATLRVLGYPRPVSPDGRKPFAYDYGTISATAPWKAHAGAYTRLGDVRELLVSVDDRFVVTRSGDEIALAFDAAAAPPLPEGWTRDFLLFTDGFGKDMDPNSATPSMVGPLPYHAMPPYPYPDVAAYSADPARAGWLDTWNTRIVPGDLRGLSGAPPPGLAAGPPASGGPVGGGAGK